MSNGDYDTVSQYTIGSDGSLTPMATATVATGKYPSSVAVDPAGRYAYVVNATQSTVSQYTIGSDGSLTPMASAAVSAEGYPISPALALPPDGLDTLPLRNETGRHLAPCFV